MKEESKIYQIAVVCGNCGRKRESLVSIPKGRRVWPGTNEIACDYCGCTGTLQRDK